VYDSWAVFVEVPFFWRTSTVYAGVRVVAVLVAADKVFESVLAVPVEPAVTPVRTKRVESAAAVFEGAVTVTVHVADGVAETRAAPALLVWV
jgi:hypothetical protein